MSGALRESRHPQGARPRSRGVFVVDDDPSVRAGLRRLMTSAGYEVRTYASSSELLDDSATADAGCLVLDLQMPESTGLELQDELERRGLDVPIVFLTGYGTVSAGVDAMKGGAIDFLEKPAPADELLSAVDAALQRGASERRARRELEELAERLDRLTPREREVLGYVVAGRLNKQTAAALGVTEKTIKVHRARVMTKMQADSLAHLVRMTEQLGIEPESD